MGARVSDILPIIGFRCTTTQPDGSASKVALITANLDKLLDSVPKSDHFTVTGKPEIRCNHASPSNDMRLFVEPLPRTLYRENADGIFWIGGAAANLAWKGRTLKGRVLFDYLQRHNWNRFTADFGANWQEL